MTSPDLSVVVLTYNTRKLTLACLHALFGQPEIARCEVIVVDNASGDQTAEVVAEEYPGAQLIHAPKNLGFGGGNNLGLIAARGRYVLLLNSDTEVQPGALLALINFMDAHPEAGACGPMLLNTDGSLQPSGRALPTAGTVFLDMTRLYRLTRRDVFVEPGRDYNQVKRVGEISGAALLIRRSLYERIGGFDTGLFLFYEDVDLCKRVGDAGFGVYYVPEAKVVHHWGGTMQKISELAYRAGQDSLRYYFAKHHRRPAQVFVASLLFLKEIAFTLLSIARGRRGEYYFHRKMLARLTKPVDR
ncbi:MAG TPA: glycosyltransferase family 2 protein [Thermoflexales bacterium]|nr:glycosyltransferase family 2 protein [Thermoflexales bacterium]